MIGARDRLNMRSPSAIHVKQQANHAPAASIYSPSVASMFNQAAAGAPKESQLDAVIVRNLTYQVGSGRSSKLILNKINLTVPEGSIYGLLGPSGCGKTTMLRCVVGRIQVARSSGSILVFGCQPGRDEQAQVPGRNVGYMPQEISIYEDFTIEETLRYFGKINRLRGSEIRERIEFLLQFLDLPSKKRLVANLSGGQKRRVSLAAALVHSPPLLILDEPTVGVDPLLRQNIWQHLVTLTQSEKISVIITTHYIEEARQADVVGLMRHGKILAESSPDELMRVHGFHNLEDVFLKLCVTDSALRSTMMVSAGTGSGPVGTDARAMLNSPSNSSEMTSSSKYSRQIQHKPTKLDYSRRWESLRSKDRLHGSKASRRLEASLYTRPVQRSSSSAGDSDEPTADRVESSNLQGRTLVTVKHTQYNKARSVATVTTGGGHQGYSNQLSVIDSFSSEESVDTTSTNSLDMERKYPKVSKARAVSNNNALYSEEYITLQAIKWASRRSQATNLMNLDLRGLATHTGRRNRSKTDQWSSGHTFARSRHIVDKGFAQWWRTLMAVTWKNYVRLRRNPPVLIFQFMLPAIQVILFCLCIGGEPFDVPVAVVNDELDPRSSKQFLEGLSSRVIRQVRYDNLSSAIEAVKLGKVWGVIHIPDKYTENLQSRMIMGEDVNSETIGNGTIKVYPDLTNLHLALTLETTFRETFIKFARDSIEGLGYNRSLADPPIQMGSPIYGSMRKDGYLEFMAPGVVISISYVMATGLTALAFILERRDGLLERSLVSGVQTSQILLAHAINQVFVMVIQIFMVLGCTFFVFEIPSQGSFSCVILLILLQGCTGMGFGLLVSAICKEENTAVMMVVGTFYTNLILAGIIWPIEAMPHWIRPLSYAQPQTIPTESLRNILSRGWGITDLGVLSGFAVTIGWLIVFLMAAGVVFKYSK